MVLETNGSGSTIASYVLGGNGIVSQSRSGTTNYYLQDGQGSTRALTNGSGAITDTYSYTAFGELLNQTGSMINSYLYTGQQFDSLTGLYDLRARYYNPALGRFLSQDTYPYNFNNPVELNRYGYTANNPINLVDPSGYSASAEFSILLFFQRAATGAALGALGGAVYGIVASLICTGDVNWGSVGSSALTGAIGGAMLYGAGTPGLSPWLAPGIGTALGSAGLYGTAKNAGNVNVWCTLLNGLASAAAFMGSFRSGFLGGPPAPVFCYATCGGGSVSAAQGVITNPSIWGTLGTLSMMSDDSVSDGPKPRHTYEEYQKEYKWAVFRTKHALSIIKGLQRRVIGTTDDPQINQSIESEIFAWQQDATFYYQLATKVMQQAIADGFDASSWDPLPSLPWLQVE